MKAKKILFYFGVFIFSMSMLTLTSCKKSSSTTDANETTATDNTLADNLSSDAENASDQAVANAPTSTKALILSSTADSASSEANSISSSSGSTVTITWVTGDTSKAGSITINFGTGILCLDGKTRSGEITVSWTGRYLETGTKITYSSSNYTVNSNQISFLKTVTNKGLTVDSVYGESLLFSVYDSLVVTKATGGTLTWKANRSRIMITGWRNPFKFWNVCYAIRGGGSGVSASGTSYTHKILLDLIKPVIVKYFIAGEYQISGPKETITVMIGSTGKLPNWKLWGLYTAVPTVTVTEDNLSTGVVTTKTITQD